MLLITILTNSYLGHVKLLVGKLLDKHLRLKHIISITIDMMFCKSRQYGIIIVVVLKKVELERAYMVISHPFPFSVFSFKNPLNQHWQSFPHSYPKPLSNTLCLSTRNTHSTCTISFRFKLLDVELGYLLGDVSILL